MSHPQFLDPLKLTVSINHDTPLVWGLTEVFRDGLSCLGVTGLSWAVLGGKESAEEGCVESPSPARGFICFSSGPSFFSWYNECQAYKTVVQEKPST